MKHMEKMMETMQKLTKQTSNNIQYNSNHTYSEDFSSSNKDNDEPITQDAI